MEHLEHVDPGAPTVTTEERQDLRAPSPASSRAGELVLEYCFAPDPAAPGEARARTSSALETSPHVDTVLVLVSELVTNAVIHTHHESELRVFTRESTNGHAPIVRVEVQDHVRMVPASPPVPGAHGGYGLRIVAALADAWGCTVLDDGKIVWFEIGARA